MLASFYSILDDYKLAIILYSSSYALDAIDGLAARLFNQSSLFGSMLDMLTDRVSTMCLLMTLGHFYTDYFFVLQMLLIIDIVSHWLHFFSSTIQGKISHKRIDSQSNLLMRIYYENKLILTSVCAMEQIFYCSLVVYHFEQERLGFYLLWPMILSLPAIIFKNYINCLQIWGACKVMANSDLQASLHSQ